MAKYQVLYWHDIPVQVRARDKTERVSKELPKRFMEAVDKAAMASKSVDGESYTNGFHWGERQERDGTAQEVADAVAAELDTQYPTINYRATSDRIKAERKQTEE